MEDVFINDAVEIDTTPEKIFEFLKNLKDDKSYCAWQEGSIVYAEEYLNKELHKLEFKVVKYADNKEIVYVPTSRFLRRYVPKLP